MNMTKDFLKINWIDLKPLFSFYWKTYNWLTWELHCLAKSYKHYIVLLVGGSLCTYLSIINRVLVCSHFFHVMMNSKFTKFNIGLISKWWYLEDIQDQSIGFNFQDKTIGIVTQFQQSNGNELVMATDLHVLNELRGPDIYIWS